MIVIISSEKKTALRDLSAAYITIWLSFIIIIIILRAVSFRITFTESSAYSFDWIMNRAVKRESFADNICDVKVGAGFKGSDRSGLPGASKQQK